MPELTLLKLGGSLITDKTAARALRSATLARLAAEIAAVWQARGPLPLILGHGSGSFGHHEARKYGTRQGVHSPEEWLGFVEVWRAADQLNRYVMDALAAAGLPAVRFSASAMISASGGRVTNWNIQPLQAALQAGLLPVIYGDVVFDAQLGGTILSTEDLFHHLVAVIQPRRILLAGLEAGVWADFPACTRLLETIHPGDLAAIAGGLKGSHGADVTGGMADKVRQALGWVQAAPGLQAVIFSAETPGLLQSALEGASPGTLLTA